MGLDAVDVEERLHAFDHATHVLLQLLRRTLGAVAKGCWMNFFSRVHSQPLAANPFIDNDRIKEIDA